MGEIKEDILYLVSNMITNLELKSCQKEAKDNLVLAVFYLGCKKNHLKNQYKIEVIRFKEEEDRKLLWNL